MDATMRDVLNSLRDRAMVRLAKELQPTPSNVDEQLDNLVLSVLAVGGTIALELHALREAYQGAQDGDLDKRADAPSESIGGAVEEARPAMAEPVFVPAITVEVHMLAEKVARLSDRVDGNRDVLDTLDARVGQNDEHSTEVSAAINRCIGARGSDVDMCATLWGSIAAMEEMVQTNATSGDCRSMELRQLRERADAEKSGTESALGILSGRICELERFTLPLIDNAPRDVDDRISIGNALLAAQQRLDELEAWREVAQANHNDHQRKLDGLDDIPDRVSIIEDKLEGIVRELK